MHPNNGAGAGFVDMDDELDGVKLPAAQFGFHDDDDETAQAQRLERALRTLASGSAVEGGGSSNQGNFSSNVIFRGIGSASSSVGGLGSRDEGASAAAAVYLLRGRAYEEVGNRARH